MILGITGGSGAGKSLASDFFRNHGFVIIDYDSISREVCKAGSPCLKELTEFFGTEILNRDLSLDRKKLGETVYANRDKLDILNRVTHKYINELGESLIAENKGRNIVLDAPLLFEAGLHKKCHRILGVISDDGARISRITARDGISATVAKNRIASQKDNCFYEKNCDYVVHNNGTQKQFFHKLENILKELESEFDI